MQTILPLIPEGSNQINEIVSVSQTQNEWIYYIGCYPIYRHKSSNNSHFRLTIAQLIDSGSCRPCEIISVFGIAKSKVLRAVKQLRERGVSSFFERKKYREGGTVFTPGKLKQAQRLLDRGMSRDEISRELDIKYDTLRKAINDGRLSESKAPVSTQSILSERSRKDSIAAAGMGTACTRPIERLLSALGVINGASIEFEYAADVLNGGVLCAIPALLANGLLQETEKLAPIRGYYSVEQILLVIAYMYLCRIKNIEQLRGYAPGEFGKLLGLDRIPEARCLRNKLDTLSGEYEAEEWSSWLARYWMEESSHYSGFLYVDGHVKVYSGNNDLPRRFVSRERLCLRGITNYWVNDILGQPFFAIEKQIDSGLIQTLENEIVPRLLESVPNQPSEEILTDKRYLHRFIIIFDREGYSPAFFKKMWQEHRIACMTYRKNCNENWPEDTFLEIEATMPNGEVVKMKLAERGSLIGQGKDAIWVKEVRKLTKTGHQTAIISTGYSLEAIVIAPAMFARWCQENFFAYAMHHFCIDSLTAYGEEPFSGTEKLVNPEWRDIERMRNSANGKLIRRQAKFVCMDSQASADPNHKSHQKWLNKKSELLQEIQLLESDIENLKEKKKEVSHHITWDELSDEQKFMKMPSARRRLLNTIAMIAYRAETSMASILQNNSKQISLSKARVILQDLFTANADIQPDMHEKTLRINIHCASTPADNKQRKILLEQLNDTETIFPMTELKMIFDLIDFSP